MYFWLFVLQSQEIYNSSHDTFKSIWNRFQLIWAVMWMQPNKFKSIWNWFGQTYLREGFKSSWNRFEGKHCHVNAIATWNRFEFNFVWIITHVISIRFTSSFFLICIYWKWRIQNLVLETQIIPNWIGCVITAT